MCAYIDFEKEMIKWFFQDKEQRQPQKEHGTTVRKKYEHSQRKEEDKRMKRKTALPCLPVIKGMGTEMLISRLHYVPYQWFSASTTLRCVSFNSQIPQPAQEILEVEVQTS